MILTRRESIKALAALGAVRLLPRVAFGRPLPAEWAARWVTHPSAPYEPAGIYLYRLVVSVGVPPASLVIRVSADQRFKLCVNGAWAGNGPAFGDPNHWRYETIDIAPFLKSGRNSIAAVSWFGANGTTAIGQMGFVPGFLLCAQDPPAGFPEIDTGTAAWVARRNPGHAFLPIRHEDAPNFLAIAPMDQIDASRFPWDWKGADGSLEGWDPVQNLLPGRPREMSGVFGDGGHFLEPDPLPWPDYIPEPLGKAVRAVGLPGELPPGALESAPVVVPPGGTASVLFDHGVMTTAYVALEAEGGAGATVKLRYTEALIDSQGRKGQRAETAGMHCRGYADEFHLNGGRRTFEPLYWRAFRFVQVEVVAGAEPVTLHTLKTTFFTARLPQYAAFEASDPELTTLWKTGIRTVRCNAHEIFSDCPYWEQMQYIADTRISALISLGVSGMAAEPIVRNALMLFDDSRLPDGLTQSRYPTREVQIVPTFSLIHVLLAHDYWMRVEGEAPRQFLVGLLPGIRGILDWFSARLGPDLLLAQVPWWNFVDWSYPNGVPPGGEKNGVGSSVLTLHFTLALQAAAALEEALGDPAVGSRDRALAERLCRAVHDLSWDKTVGQVADLALARGSPTYSPAASAFAILTGTLDPAEARRAARGLASAALSRPVTDDVQSPSLYFRYYVHRALLQAGQADHYLDWLGPWRRALALGLTTWPETAEPTRSDCHAWSAHPTLELLEVVLGVSPASPGYGSVTVAPHLGPLDWAQGTVPHPRGPISVAYKRVAGGLDVRIDLPPGVEGTFAFGGRQTPLKGSFRSVVSEA